MLNFLKRLFGGGDAPSAPAPVSARPALPPLPAEIGDEFLAWLREQKRPAVALVPNRELPVGAAGTRLFGPAFLKEGEEWPCGSDGKTLDFLAQLDLADCSALEGYPRTGIVQFFIGRDDLFGANLENLDQGNFLVRLIDPGTPGALHASPHKDDFDTSGIDDYSPSYDFEARLRGVALEPQPIIDQMDLSVVDASKRFFALPKEYDLNPLYDAVDAIAMERPPRHHTGGYPAFIQSDIREYGKYLECDHVLLRLTSDDLLMWGDVGECVFMMPGEDLAKGDFSRVVYSWDCS